MILSSVANFKERQVIFTSTTVADIYQRNELKSFFWITATTTEKKSSTAPVGDHISWLRRSSDLQYLLFFMRKKNILFIIMCWTIFHIFLMSQMQKDGDSLKLARYIYLSWWSTASSVTQFLVQTEMKCKLIARYRAERLSYAKFPLLSDWTEMWSAIWFAVMIF